VTGKEYYFQREEWSAKRLPILRKLSAFVQSTD
jgi:hypothetical protein